MRQNTCCLREIPPELAIIQCSPLNQWIMIQLHLFNGVMFERFTDVTLELSWTKIMKNSFQFVPIIHCDRIKTHFLWKVKIFQLEIRKYEGSFPKFHKGYQFCVHHKTDVLLLVKPELIVPEVWHSNQRPSGYEPTALSIKLVRSVCTTNVHYISLKCFRFLISTINMYWGLSENVFWFESQQVFNFCLVIWK